MPSKFARPKPILKPGVIYTGDNGQRICLKCAGASALYTGRDLSGFPVTPLTDQDAADWFSYFNKPLSCEEGCTTYQ